jgi:hypothetical protein
METVSRFSPLLIFEEIFQLSSTERGRKKLEYGVWLVAMPPPSATQVGL